MRTAFRPTRRRLVNHDYSHAAHASIPTFLCPVLLRTPLTSPGLHVQATRSSQAFSSFRRNRQETAGASHPPLDLHEPPPRQSLPRACPGCGAPTQVFDKDEAGYYDIDRRVVKAFLDYAPGSEEEGKKENDVYTKALKQADPKLLEELGLDKEALDAKVEKAAPSTPVCDRCHKLIHHSVGTPIHHPSVSSIQATIAESPHRRNHIYHVLDAADFPLSLVPNLQSALRLPKLRTQNRRARHKGWVANNRIAEVSFIITRADLLAPLKEQVDRLMPYMQNVLRDALGRVNNKARLGNVRLVSAKRGWWTKQVKEDIWDRGGAGWMVGKVNVGKSNLFEVVFPKGRGADFQDIRRIRSAAEREAMLNNAKSLDEIAQVQKQLADEDAEFERRKNQPQNHLHEPPEFEELDEEAQYDPDSILPPPQPYTPYPVLPIASSLPGTTASPIRIPFGRNRGELVDLPGLARTSPGLESFVRPTEHDQLIMKHRIAAERYVLKRGQSLILGGGLIRITPQNEDLIFLVHPFVPITPHITSTDKAIGLQTQTVDLHVPSILTDGAGATMKSAGRFQLKWDVTKQLAGPLTSSIAGKMRPENLPFRIWSTDILIEGVGWVEISAQVRRPRGWKPVGLVKKDPNHAQHARRRALDELDRKRQEKFAAAADNVDEGSGDAFDQAGMGAGRRSMDAFDNTTTRVQEHSGDAFADAELGDEGDERGPGEEYPEIEVFSPLGKFVGARRPMCGSVLGGPKPVSSRDRNARPRRSMVSVKRQRKPQENKAQAG